MLQQEKTCPALRRLEALELEDLLLKIEEFVSTFLHSLQRAPCRSELKGVTKFCAKTTKFPSSSFKPFLGR